MHRSRQPRNNAGAEAVRKVLFALEKEGLFEQVRANIIKEAAPHLPEQDRSALRDYAETFKPNLAQLFA